MVIRYSYLWRSDYLRGLEEGQKDRPCAIILAVDNASGGTTVTVLPITHRPPSGTGQAVEIPAATKRRLGLDDDRSWVVLTEANRFIWPGPDLRRVDPRNPGNYSFGELPHALFIRIRNDFLAAARNRTASMITRSQ